MHAEEEKEAKIYNAQFYLGTNNSLGQPVHDTLVSARCSALSNPIWSISLSSPSHHTLSTVSNCPLQHLCKFAGPLAHGVLDPQPLIK